MWAMFTFSSPIHTRNVRNDGDARDNNYTDVVSSPNPEEGICIDFMYMIVCVCMCVCVCVCLCACVCVCVCVCVWGGNVQCK